MNTQEQRTHKTALGKVERKCEDLATVLDDLDTKVADLAAACAIQIEKELTPIRAEVELLSRRIDKVAQAAMTARVAIDARLTDLENLRHARLWDRVRWICGREV